MNNQHGDDGKPEGLDVGEITFDENGEVSGVPDEVLDAVSGGLMQADNGTCPSVNINCAC